MSRYQIDQGDYRVAVGWDQKRATFFFCAYRLAALAEFERLEQMYLDMAVSLRGHDSLLDQIAAAEADCGPICWRGFTQGEISTTAELQLLVAFYADLPADIVSRLIADKMRNPSEMSSLDRFIKRLTVNATRRSADRS